MIVAIAAIIAIPICNVGNGFFEINVTIIAITAPIKNLQNPANDAADPAQCLYGCNAIEIKFGNINPSPNT